MADLALVGLMPEQVAAALQGNASKPQRQREPVLAGVDARTARAYTYVSRIKIDQPLCEFCPRSIRDTDRPPCSAQFR